MKIKMKIMGGGVKKDFDFKREVMVIKYALFLLSEPLGVVRSINRARSPNDTLFYYISILLGLIGDLRRGNYYTPVLCSVSEQPFSTRWNMAAVIVYGYDTGIAIGVQ